MDIEAFRDYCLAKKGVTEELPFGPDTLVFKVMGKVFALTGLERLPQQVNLKCAPERALALRESYDGAIIAGYHMNKAHWNTIILHKVPSNLVAELIDHSYDLVVAKFTKKLRAEYEGLD
ncbi:MmcQ/YjbR family DNA-binding protein [Pseudozobellia thermophila]|uniref:Predicted DNA-binding protein, MmcQ/YjbR family n=1 Tax=Pseudozobellia thermophila TaxID=192903 RepID=A0A1M6MZK6_9FLAO|nr:MmcQ/YjbR family DNA-binding protein [Pseudozobellia thermophila]SHJ88945.1 Predicted DNA-binding protein, MmcQ/YjbR family [Pseudozobellia thermophila]